MTGPLQTARMTHLILREKLLEQMPELADDPECLLDTLEGLTDLTDQLAALVRSAVSDEAKLEGLTQYQIKLAERRAALRERAERKRRLALNYMTELDIKKIITPDLSITRKRVAPAVIIADEAALPDNLMRVKREPDKTAIKAELLSGKPVPGATLSNGSETLQVKI